MLLDAALYLMMFGTVAIVICMALVITTLIACAYAVTLWKRGQRTRALLTLTLAIPIAAGLPISLAYLFTDHREQRELHLDFRTTQPDVIRQADTSCRQDALDSEFENCLSNKYITKVSVTLADGAQIDLRTTDMSWRSHKRQGITYIGFRSLDSYSVDQAIALIEADTKKFADPSDKETMDQIASLTKWLRSCVGNSSNLCGTYDGANLRVKPQLRIWFHKSYKEKQVTTRYDVYATGDRR